MPTTEDAANACRDVPRAIGSDLEPHHRILAGPVDVPGCVVDGEGDALPDGPGMRLQRVPLASGPVAVVGPGGRVSVTFAPTGLKRA